MANWRPGRMAGSMAGMMLAFISAIAPAEGTDGSGQFWCHSVCTGLVLSRRSRRPILIRVNDARGSSFLDPALDDPSLALTLNRHTLVLADSYEDVTTAFPAMPDRGDSSLVLVDERGRVLRRFGGFLRASDLKDELTVAENLSVREPAILAALARNPSDPDARLAKNALDAMRGRPSSVAGMLALIPPPAARGSVPARTTVFEAVADELRLRRNYPEAAETYVRALALRPSRVRRFRLQMHLAGCYLRMGRLPQAEGLLKQAALDAGRQTEEEAQSMRVLRFLAVRRG